MMPLQNTLYVTTQEAYLHKEGEAVVVKVGDETRLRVPVHTLCGIVCFGHVLCSPALLGLCADRSVSVSFLSERGRFLARIEGATSGNVLLRREQYRRADDPAASARLAQAFVSAKVFNARIVLMRAARDHPDTQGRPEVEAAATRLGQVVDDLRQDRELDAIRGMEGDAARVYFSVFDHLITTQKEDFFFHERTRRPPMDSMNALLSFLYTILAHDCRSALESVGLDPQVGFLHRDRPGRPSLALDLLEEFRPLLADRVALSLVNLRQLQSKGFRIHEAGAVFMDDETRKTVLATYQKRKREEIEHPFLGEKIAAGLLPYLQARLLSRHLRGDLDAYPPFLWK